MRKYEKYKPSGVEWIGDIPEHWEVKRLKFAAVINPNKKELVGLPETLEISFYPMEAIGFGYLNKGEEKLLGLVSNGFTYFRDNDILVAKITPSFENGKGALATRLKNGIGFGTTEIHVIRAQMDLNKYFLYYLTYSHPFRHVGAGMMEGTAGQKRVPNDFLINYIIALPKLDEQTAIANYLDEKTEQIDSLIAKKQKMIELLKEERAAIINRAVTKGINPDVKLKPSGIEWLGDIPDHWEVKKLKYVVRKVGSGITPRGGAAVYQDNGIPLLRSQNIHNEGLNLDDVAYISDEIDEEMSNSRIQDNDVLLNITGASIGRCNYVPEDFGLGNVNQHVCTIRPIISSIQTKFLHSILISGYGQTLIDICQTGANREGLNFQQIKSFELPIPTPEEQKTIILYIDSESNKIDTTISKIEKEIELLQEYRTALISEVVTGKIDVRNEVA